MSLQNVPKMINDQLNQERTCVEHTTKSSENIHNNDDDGESKKQQLSKRIYPEIDVLIMSEAGKPIYCYSDRDDVITLMGVCVALVNFVLKTQNDNLRSIHTRSGLHINFALRPPLIIVVVCRQHSCFDENTLINQINAQIISTITLKSLKSVFQQAPTYDLKRLIHSNEFKTMDILVQSISSPIANTFPSYRHYQRSIQKANHLLKTNLFNNVISFYTSTSMVPSTTIPLSKNPNHTTFVLNEHKPNVLSRVYVPIAIIPLTIREQITSIINHAVVNYTDIVFSILFTIVDDESIGNLNSEEIEHSRRSSNTMRSSLTSEEEFLDAIEDQLNTDQIENVNGNTNCSYNTRNLKLVTVNNHTVKQRINPLDIQLIYALINASDGQLSSTESLWLPLCLSRIDPNRFMYAHISYLTEKYCLVLLDLDHGDFQRCQQAKETIQSKICKIPLTEPMNEMRSCISELGYPRLQYICQQTPRHCIMWQSATQVDFSNLNYYLIERMQRSSLKTCWLRSSREQCVLLGWHTATFQLYAQFDYEVNYYEALDVVQAFIKWFKKEEDKLIIKDT